MPCPEGRGSGRMHPATRAALLAALLVTGALLGGYPGGAAQV